MSIQSGRGGYDPTLTITEQLVKLNALLSTHLANGREGSHVIESVRAQIATLQKQQTAHQAAQTAAIAALAAQSATTKGTVAPVYAHLIVTE